MQYRYAPNRNYQDYASGRVFYAQAGQPAFPVRLASEIFQRALAHWQDEGRQERVNLYDPVCGGGYWLAVLGTLHREQIAAIFASDIDPEVLSLAKRNLSLLAPAGLDRRITEIEAMLAEYAKESHAEALASAWRFRNEFIRDSEPQGREESRFNLERESSPRSKKRNLDTCPIATRVFQADATNPENLRRGLGDQPIDLVLADVPYGWHTTWVTTGERDLPPVAQMLQALQTTLKSGAVVVIAADKGQKVGDEGNLQRIEHFRVGRRRVFILQKKG